jgi:hypothetical protein
MKKILSILGCLLLLSAGKAQNQSNQKPCTAAESSQFDFWVGDWDLTWNDTSHGSNKIYKIFDGCTVQENFYDPAKNYKGQSWSVYNPNSKMWQQTWVDNQGSYIALTGNYENGEMKLTTQPRKLQNGKEMISRMVYYNIKPNNFDWRWEASTDNGDTWKTNWLIHYKRKS